ncbi:MAG: 5'-methylthioadenosine/adenosylhomocysteine nucleosidase [bacterium]|nr:5'-methylthioadenosine/adenosylhomocysteine nucleosidase [bacterium]
MFVAIIAAMQEELDAIKSRADGITEVVLYNEVLYTCKLNGVDCVLALSGIGKVNAARLTQILIDNFKVRCLINVGSAGALKVEHNIGDVVVSTDCVQVDFDLTAFGREMGVIPNVGKHIHADRRLIEVVTSAVDELVFDLRVVKGIVATQDRFESQKEEKLRIGRQFDAECIEMEGAAIAQVCSLNEIPFVVIRSISDIVNDSSVVDFEEFLPLAAKKCSDLLFCVINKL